MGEVTFDISISVDGYASSASPGTPIAPSETAVKFRYPLDERVPVPA
jgi:hypothetical protein